MIHYQEAIRVFEQESQALSQTLRRIETTFDKVVDLCLACRGKLVIAGVGKSGIIGHKMAATLASTGTPAVFLNAGEALHGDLGMVTADDVVVFLSNSAKTPELLRMLPSVRKIGARTLGILGAIDTPLAESMDLILDARIDEEACPLRLAPMTSCTVALVVGDALAAALIRARGFSAEDFAVFHPGGSLGRRLLYRVRDIMQTGDSLPVVESERSLRETIQVLARYRMGAVLVADSSRKLTGILVEGDVRRLYLEQVDPDKPIREVMTADPKTIDGDALLGEAIEQMERGDRKVYVLPVVREDRTIEGILRMHDIVSI